MACHFISMERDYCTLLWVETALSGERNQIGKGRQLQELPAKAWAGLKTNKTFVKGKYLQGEFAEAWKLKLMFISVTQSGAVAISPADIHTCKEEKDIFSDLEAYDHWMLKP